MREAQGGDGLLVPDWGQSVFLGIVPSSAGIPIPGAEYIDIGDSGLLWESITNFETVNITTDSNGVTIDSVAGNYTAARLIPLWTGDAPEGVVNSRGGARINQISVAMVLSDNRDLAVTPAVAYRSLDVLDECPVIASGELGEGFGWPVSAFYIRQRAIPNQSYSMRWHLFTRAEQFALRGWLHYRRGRQKAFWMSSRGKDLEPAANVSGVTVRVFAFPGLTGLGRTDPFDIEIKTTATSYYRRVSAATAGPTTDGRATINMTIDSSATVSLADIERISFLRCTRLDADRVELLHQAAGGMAVQVPMIEIPTP
jgi:hypothetical protein